MKKSFDTFEYIKDLGKDLIRDFEKSAKTTHPHSVGDGREKSAINKLKDILPDGVGVGSGFIIDSYGNVSSQCDIIIYEKNLCLKFNNDDERNRYYNCESVIAVGEVKSDIRKKELLDTLQKMKKIKNLKRYTKNDNSFRRYLTTQGLIGTNDEKIDQKNKSLDQIFTFLICNSFKMSIDKIIEEIKLVDYKKYEYMNCLISVDGKFISYAKCENNIYYSSLGANDADTITYSQIDYSFSMLLKLIFHIINCGRTVSYNPNIYICDNSNYTSINYQF